MKAKFLVSRNFNERLEFIQSIKGKKIAIYKEESPLLKEFDVCIDMNLLMKDDYMLTNLAKCDSKTTIVLIDILIKSGVYVHPYGKVYNFTEQAKETLIIDSFAFKWDEKQIVRPFLFIDPSILGSSMINFWEGKDNTLENYYKTIKPFIKISTPPLEIQTILYTPTEDEIKAYEVLKERIILTEKLAKTKIVEMLISYVDGLESKKQAFLSNSAKYANAYVVTSNKPKMKFKVYETLKNEGIEKVFFFSSGVFGADEIELNKTRTAIERHNDLIRLINGKEI